MSTKAPEQFLSASKIKTLEGCSWLYWVKYILKLPDVTNQGAQRGTICHNVFELLLKPRHEKYVKRILADKGMKNIPPINKMVLRFLKKNNICSDENYESVNSMIFIGVNNDFYGKEDPVMGKEAFIDKPEQAFEIKNESPKYNIRGFIDKPIQYKKHKIVKIVDYKSSKSKFKGEELESNVQAMMYSLASRSLWPTLKPKVEFLFLKFPKQPYQVLEYSEDQLTGFEYYLAQVQKVVNSFSEKSAKTNFAIDGGYSKSWMCGPTKSGWECPYKKPLTYFALVDKNGQETATAFKAEELPSKEGCSVQTKKYSGCPKFSPK